MAEHVGTSDRGGVMLDKVNAHPVDFNDFFNFDGFDSGNESHSPATASTTHTPPMHNQLLADDVTIANNLGLGFDYDMPLFGGADLDYLNEKPTIGNGAMGGPSNLNTHPVQDIQVKQEPVEFGWGYDFSATGMNPSASTSPIQQQSNLAALQTTSTARLLPLAPPPPPESAPSPAESLPNFANLPFEQQMALQQLMLNIMAFQANTGMMDAKQAAPTTTVDPNQIFGTASAPPAPTLATSAPSIAATSVPQTVPSAPIRVAAPAHTNAAAGPSKLPAQPFAEDDDELVSISDIPAPRGRSMSTFSASSNLDDRISHLAPLSSIFSAGRGKGGKKGGGMSSVVRGEDEDMDDDDSWRPSAEEYKKLSSKEKRQLRNKLSARAFRNRRKDYIGTLEGHIKERDVVIDEMRSELQTSRTENQDLRRELEALKKSTMSIIHPATAVNSNPADVPSVISALQLPIRSSTPTPLTPRKVNAPTPQFNPRKDVSANGRGRGGDGIFGGPPTICHTILTPEVSLQLPTGLAGAPRQNLNPLLSAPASRGSTSPGSAYSSSSSPASTASSSSTSVYTTASSASSQAYAALNLQQPHGGDNISHGTFAQWTDENPFSLRSMDAYRMQMWSRLAREAQCDKAGLKGDMRPKFFVEKEKEKDWESAEIGKEGVKQLSAKLAHSFIGAFNAPSSHSASTASTDEGLTAVVTGRQHLKQVRANNVNAKVREEHEVDLIEALSGLKLQAGPGMGMMGGSSAGLGLGVRSDPLGIIGGFLRHAAHPTRA